MVLTLLISGTTAWAQEQRAILPMSVNEVVKGEVVAVMRGDDILLPVSAFEQSGVRIGATGTREEIAGEQYVSLSSLRPLIAHRLDEQTFSLFIHADPKLLASSRFDISTGAPSEVLRPGNRSAFLNYGVAYSQENDFSLAGEIGLSSRNRLFTTTLNMSSDDELQRGLTSYIIDRPESMARLTFGDRVSRTDILGGSPLLGGVTLSREFQLQPYFVRYPSLGLQGVAETPSVIEVYNNGVLVDRREVPPGPFNLANVPISSGTGVARVVVRDAFGRETAQESPYYFSTLTLTKGLSDFSYSAGVVRENVSTEIADYGDAAMSAYHRYGITDSVTIGGRLEASEDLYSAGPSLSFRFRFGEVDAVVAASSSDGTSGNAGYASYRYVSRRFNAGASAGRFSDDYVNLSLPREADRATSTASVIAGTTLYGQSVSATYERASMRDAGARSNVTLALNSSISSRYNLSFSLNRSTGNGVDTNSVFAGVGIQLGRLSSVNVGVRSQDGRFGSRVEMQKAITVGEGFGYHLTAENSDDDETGYGQVEYQGRYGRYGVSFDPTELGDSATLRMSGGVIAIGGAVMATRPIEQSFALVRVPGVSNVRVFSSNQEIGRTNHRGDLLVPNLLPFYGNRLRIEDQDVPFNYEIKSIEKLVAPSVRGGALVPFEVRKMQSIVGSITLEKNGQAIVPSLGQITLEREEGNAVSPIGRDGEFYFDSIPAGSYHATVEFQGEACRFDFNIPPSAEEILRIGKLTCAFAPSTD